MKNAVIHSDGASSGNPGDSGIGIVIAFEDRLVEISEYIGSTTNNVAEYTALIRGLEKARSLHIESVTAYVDSELVVKQLSGEYKVKNERLKELWDKVKKLAGHFRHFSISHIPREQNKKADALAKKASIAKPKTQVVSEATPIFDATQNPQP